LIGAGIESVIPKIWSALSGNAWVNAQKNGDDRVKSSGLYNNSHSPPNNPDSADDCPIPTISAWVSNLLTTDRTSPDRGLLLLLLLSEEEHSSRTRSAFKSSKFPSRGIKASSVETSDGAASIDDENNNTTSLLLLLLLRNVDDDLVDVDVDVDGNRNSKIGSCCCPAAAGGHLLLLLLDDDGDGNMNPETGGTVTIFIQHMMVATMRRIVMTTTGGGHDDEKENMETLELR